MADAVGVKAETQIRFTTVFLTLNVSKTVKSLPSERPRDETKDSVARR